MKLENFHEIVGTLSKVESNGQHMKVEFMIRKVYEIPLDAISIEKLESAIGNRVGIFNCDGNYRIRKANRK